MRTAFDPAPWTSHRVEGLARPVGTGPGRPGVFRRMSIDRRSGYSPSPAEATGRPAAAHSCSRMTACRSTNRELSTCRTGRTCRRARRDRTATTWPPSTTLRTSRRWCGFDVPRLGDISGTRRRAPAVPHRHGHGVVGATRRGTVTGYDFSPSAIAEATRLAARAGADATTDVRRRRAVRRGRRARRVTLRSRLHRGRRAVLAARHRAVGTRRGRAPAAGWQAAHPRGASDHLDACPIHVRTASS